MADDYSAIADPVAEPKANDYSSIAVPLQHVESTQDFSAIANPIGSGDSVDYKKLADKVEAAKPDLRNIDPAKGGLIENFKRGLGVLFAKKSLGERYNESVDKAFETNLPEVKRYQTDSSDPAALQVAAGVENVANSAAAGAVSPGGISMLNPITAPAALLYSAPRFIGQGIDALRNIGSDKSTQQNVENVLGGTLGVLGGVAGGVHGVKGLAKQMPSIAPKAPAPIVEKGPSLVAQMDGDTHGTPAVANVAANEIAMKPAEPVPAPGAPAAQVPATPPETPVVAQAPVAATAPAPVEQPAQLGPEAQRAGAIKLATIAKEINNPDNYLQYSVFPGQEGYKSGKPFIAQVDLIDKKTGENTTSANSELLTELGHYVYQNKDIPDNIKPGAYTEPQLEQAIKDASSKPDVSNLLKGDNFDKEWKDQGGQGGSENQVIFKDGQVIKRNYNGKLGQALVNYGGDLEKFKTSVELHNELFPSTKQDIIGVSDTSDGPAPVVSQPEIKGKPATQKEIIDMMRRKGFEPDGGPNYINKEAGIRVEDLRTANVLKDANGELHVIDSVIKEIAPKKEVAPAIENKKAYIDELLATKEITPEEHASQLAELGVKPDTKPITVSAEKPSEFVIPKELSKSAPRYKTSEVSFEDPLDKALYIIAQDAKRSARDPEFLDLVMSHTGMNEAEARAAGQQVRDRIKSLSDQAEPGEKLTLKSTQKQNAVQVESPKGVSVPSQTEVGKGVGQEVRSGVAESSASRQAGKEEIEAPSAQASVPTDEPAPAPAQAGGGGGNGGVPPGQTPGPAPSFNNPVPNYGWTPFISSTKFGKFFKEKIGTIGGNVRAVSPELYGSVTERGFKINELKYDWSKSSRDYGNLGRRLLKPEAFTELDRLLQSGLHEEAADFIKGSKHEAELTKSIDDFKKTLDAIRRAEINAGREVGLLDNYWIRQVADYEGLRKALGREPSNAVEKAIDAVKKQKKRALTAEEEQKVINDLISTSFSGQGKPGFLNARTIGEIKDNWFKYYEPSDVAIEQRINRAATDVVNRAYFGKFEPEGLAHSASGFIGAIEGNFGEIIRREIQSGKMSPEGSRVAVRNLQDFLRAESGYNEVTSKLATTIRKAQTYGYLSDLSSAIPQFGDFFLSAWRNGVLDSTKGFTNRKLDLGDIKLHQGTPETAIYSKKNSEGFVGSVFRKAVQTSIGLADGFNKGGSLNTSFHEAARDMRDVNSDTYKRLDSKWSQRFPNRWPEIKKDLQSEAFRKGDLNPNTQFFLYSELADIQPLSGEAYAQGYHQAGPFGKILYGLRSFAIKQLDVMRETGYEMMRSNNPGVRAKGLKNLVTYSLVVGIGQQFLSSYMRDKLFNRDSDASDYALSGLLSLVGLNRYFIYRAGDVGAGTAALETAVPGIGIANDLGQSAGVLLKMLSGQRKNGIKSVPDLPSALSQMQALKYVPFVGRELDAYLGPGAAREQKKKQAAAAGRPQKTTLQQLEDALIPPDTK